MLDITGGLKRIVASFLIVLAAPSFAANNVIDVLVVYTKGVADIYGGDPTTRINQLFQVTNQIYLDSGVELEVRVANALMVEYTDDNTAETALHDITYNRHPAFNSVAEARAQANADMVIFYRPYKAIHGNCGLAWVGGVDAGGDFSNPTLKDFMFAHIAFDGCGDFMTAHELGHSMGLRHSRKQDGKGGAFHYALGHGEDNKFTTIMAYQSVFNVDYWEGKVYKFSSPALNCNGSPCGIDRTNTVSGADAVHALNVAGPQIAKFFPAKAGVSSASSAVLIETSNKSSSISSGAFSSVAVSSMQSSSNAAADATDKFAGTSSAIASNAGSGGGLTLFWPLFLSGLLLIRQRVRLFIAV
jgi:hypothetical protein